MKHKIAFILISLLACMACGRTMSSKDKKEISAVNALALRVTEGTSKDKIEFRKIVEPNDSDIFIISNDDGKVIIEGNSPIAMAVGLNWYLKHVAGIHIAWNQLTHPLPDVLPLPDKPIRHATDLKHRYYLNYCTYSYSMPFWNKERWEKEIDWMALHGINMPLMLTGTEVVWRNVLKKLGYDDDAIGRFISGPAYMAWWLMNNLEGWGGPLPDDWYVQQEALAKNIVDRMRELGIEPVLPGYSGMVPCDIKERLGYEVADPGLWCGFRRPAFLSPSDPHFESMAQLYYDELTKLFGTSTYYSMDPFHEGGNANGVDLGAAARAINDAMKKANPEAKWVIQSWQENPRQALLDALAPGDLVVLDLYSDKDSKWRKPNAYGDHNWLYCMLLNFGGNVGLHGRMDYLIDGFYEARNNPQQKLIGVGTTPEGIENNPIMFELLYELPWREERIDADEWTKDYLAARYGQEPTDEILQAWDALRATVYNAPVDYRGQGTVESLFCARPKWAPTKASTWGNSQLFYSPDSTAKAASLMEKVASQYASNRNFAYDFADIKRQANADKGNRLLTLMEEQRGVNGNQDYLRILANDFLSLILEQDSILAGVPGLNVDPWLDAASDLAKTAEQRKLYRMNAARLITTWGDSIAANKGGLHDYSHREWSGILKDLYFKRWKAFFDAELNDSCQPDFYKMEEEWVEEVSNK